MCSVKMQYINFGINLIEMVVCINLIEMVVSKINTAQLFGIKMERQIDMRYLKFLTQNLGKENSAY